MRSYSILECMRLFGSVQAILGMATIETRLRYLESQMVLERQPRADRGQLLSQFDKIHGDYNGVPQTIYPPGGIYILTSRSEGGTSPQ